MVRQQNKDFVLIYTKVFGVNVTFSLTPWRAPPWGAWPVAPCWASCIVVASVFQCPSLRALQGKANDIWGCDPMMATAQTKQK